MPVKFAYLSTQRLNLPDGNVAVGPCFVDAPSWFWRQSPALIPASMLDSFASDPRVQQLLGEDSTPSLDSISYADIQQELVARGIGARGKREELVSRLRASLIEHPDFLHIKA